ncbi:MAG TPA: VCBS repeat-containing protein [Bryobacteraceae bacterium]|nr:VCBS repeat-containing protein [Bryobacteraceae bacterium]
MTRLLAGLFLTAVFAAASPKKQVLADNLTGGYQVIACDVNGDGKRDLIALAPGLLDLVWFENPSWERHVMATNLPHMINVACWSKGAHAIPTVVVAYGFSNNPADSPGLVSVLTAGHDPRQPWTVTEIDKLPTSHRLRWADIDGTGNKVLINAPLAAANAQRPNYAGHVPLSYYHPRDWKRRSISDSEEGILHGIFVTDWDHNGRDAILIGSFLGVHLYRFGRDGNWTRTEISKGSEEPWPKSGTSDISVGFLGKERFLAAIEPWHGNEAVVYRNQAGSWRREVIDDTLLDAHTIEAVDLNHDGNDEIVAGMRGKPYAVYIYNWDGSQWKRQPLEQGEVSAASCAVADLDADGYSDISCIGGATHNLVVYWDPLK